MRLEPHSSVYLHLFLILCLHQFCSYFIICFQLSLLMYLVGLNSKYMTIQFSSMDIRLSWIEL